MNKKLKKALDSKTMTMSFRMRLGDVKELFDGKSKHITIYDEEFTISKRLR